jgi:hypothetical protein
MLMPQIVFHAGDLAPGDTRSAAFDLSALRFDRIRSASDPLFEEAYGYLWLEFGKKDEMESRQALRRRFELAPRMLYEMIHVRRGDAFIAVRDHTAILDHDGQSVVVHLSHNLIATSARRTGLGGWLRALPIAAARECHAVNGIPNSGPNGLRSSARITLVAEMQHPSPDHPDEMVRLRAYEKAGFRKIDPTRVAYYQPDFRTPAEIDAAGEPCPLPFQLILRRVGREHERVISGGEARRLVQALYEIYSSHFRASDMAHPLLSLDEYPADDATIALVPPTQ